jgi:hypothetical protein
MPFSIEGIKGGDRTRMDQPSPLEHVPAIVEGWYPVQAGGSAFADVLFGDYNPAGRLSHTFYREIV